MSIDLDKRIKSINTIQTCLKYDTDCVGHNGYFFDEFCDTTDLSKCRYGELIDIVPENTNDLWFKARFISGLTNRFRFFIPEKLLKPVKKKYRPYTLAEWIGQHTIGDVIRYRCKSQKIELRHMYVGYGYGIGTDIRNTTSGTLTLGVASYTLDYLFEDYELFYNGRWLPFGVLDNGEDE